MAVAGTEQKKPNSISHANVAFFTFKYIVFIRTDSCWISMEMCDENDDDDYDGDGFGFFGFGLLSSHTTAGAKHDGWSMK